MTARRWVSDRGRRYAAVCILLMLSCGGVAAEDTRYSIGATAGTLGIGPELGLRSERFGARLNAGFFSYDRDEQVDDIAYNGDLDLDSIGITADFYPLGGGFRLSAGLRINNSEIGLTAAPTQPVTVGDATFDPDDIGTLSGSVEGEDLVPTVTLGYGGSPIEGFTLAFELGLAFQGSPKIENLQSTGGQLSGTPELEAALAEEELRIEDEVSDYDIWPIAQITFLWRF